MLASADSLGTIVMAIVAIAFLFGIGACVGAVVGRQAAQKTFAQLALAERKIPERVTRELVYCLELGEGVAREAESLVTTISETPEVPREVASAIHQLVKATKGLNARVERAGEAASVPLPTKAPLPIQQSAPQTTLPVTEAQQSQPAPPPPAPVASPESQPASKTPSIAVGEIDSAPIQDLGEEARRFPRSPCHGSLKATIYPPPNSVGGEPVHCTVLTRDLSCGGVGIAYTEELFPHQIVVLDAVGKLLVGEVRWCRRLDDRYYIAGCRLVKTND